MPTREELQQADEALKRAGYDENERLSVLLQLQEAQVPSVPGFMQPFESPTTKSGRDLQGAAQVIIPATGAMLGGSLARYGASKLMPKMLPYLGPEIAGVGEAAGAFVGGLATGQSPEQAGMGALTAGGAGVITERGLQEVGRGFARAGKVTPRTMRETLGQGGVKRVGTMIRGVPEEGYINEAEALRRGATKARVDKSPGRLSAESKMRAFDEAAAEKVPIEDVEARYNAGEYDAQIMRGGRLQNPETIRQREISSVDMKPIKQRILSLVDEKATSTGRIAVNNQLKGIANRLPDEATMAELDHFIREHTEPIKGQVQNLEASLPVGVQQKIVAGARRYRNELLPQAKADFVRAQNYMKATKNIRGMLVDKNGDLRKTAENVWRSIPRNQVVLRSFKEYDRVHGTKFAENALELARKANWTPGDGATALGMIDASVGWFGRATATTVRGIGKGFVGASIPAGRGIAAAGAAYNAMENP